MNKKTILFTFDYELFLGARPISSGSVENCLINPTNWILKVLKKHNIKHGIFFVDTLYLQRLFEESKKNPRIRSDYTNILKQLITVQKDGHYIAPHIHPHWIDAKYIEKINQWDLSNLSKYKFSELSEEQKKDVFQKSYFVLENILNIERENIDAYRAGGYCIQPFSDFKWFFENYNITNDFSAIDGEKTNNHFQNFDFTDIPNSSPFRFSNDIFQIDPNGKFLEFPITKFRYSLLPQLRYRWNKLFDNSIQPDNTLIGLRDIIQINGIHKTFSPESKPKSISRLHKYVDFLKGFEGEIMSIENITPDTLYFYISSLKKQKYCQFITHPKGISEQNRVVFETLLEKYFSRNLNRINFNYKEVVECEFRD